jgi:hypothetical protein
MDMMPLRGLPFGVRLNARLGHIFANDGCGLSYSETIGTLATKRKNYRAGNRDCQDDDGAKALCFCRR